MPGAWTGQERNSVHFSEYGSANCLGKRRQERVISRSTKLSSSDELKSTFYKFRQRETRVFKSLFVYACLFVWNVSINISKLHIKSSAGHFECRATGLFALMRYWNCPCTFYWWSIRTIGAPIESLEFQICNTLLHWRPNVSCRNLERLKPTFRGTAE